MKKKVRVLHVIGKRPQGGVGTFLYNITKYIDKSKFQFDFLINANGESGEFDEKMKALSSNVYVLSELKNKNVLLYYKQLKSFYALNYNYDIIHIHSANIAIFNFWLTRKLKNKYIAVHAHSTKYSDKFINSIRNFFLHLPIKKIADIFFACSEPAAQFMFGKKVVEKKRFHIIKNSIDSKEFLYNESIRKKIRNDLDITSQLTIGHVGAFVPVKNHEFIIDIFFEIKKLNNQAILVLVGTGELEGKIKRKVEELDLTNSVKFLGRRADVNRLMQAFDLFLMPSKFEGVPLVGVEAQAAGLPCIFSDSITKDIEIIEDTVFMSLNELPNTWAKKILECNKISQRRDTHQKIADAGYEINNEVQKLEKYYMNLLE